MHYFSRKDKRIAVAGISLSLLMPVIFALTLIINFNTMTAILVTAASLVISILTFWFFRMTMVLRIPKDQQGIELSPTDKITLTLATTASFLPLGLSGMYLTIGGMAISCSIFWPKQEMWFWIFSVAIIGWGLIKIVSALRPSIDNNAP